MCIPMIINHPILGPLPAACTRSSRLCRCNPCLHDARVWSGKMTLCPAGALQYAEALIRCNEANL